MNEDYIRTARAKGQSEGRVLSAMRWPTRRCRS